MNRSGSFFPPGFTSSDSFACTPVSVVCARTTCFPDRFTIVGLWGRYILKPQTDAYRALPELEDLTMHMAEAAKIAVVPHSLIRFADGELCYITRRIDRERDGSKIAMEDMCQLTERLTEYKYKGSYEQIAKHIKKYSAVPLNGKKARIRRSDFEKSIIASGVNEKVLDNIAKKFRKALMKWIELIEASFLPDDFKRQYKRLILKRMLMLR